MNDIKDTLNIEEHDMKKLPDMLNVLTILTYIGCGINLLTFIMNLFQDCDKAIDQLESMGEFDGFLGKYMAMVADSAVVVCENKTLVLLTTFVGLLLCLWGAIQIRNLKKQGFVFYTIGELLAPIVVIILSLSSSSIVMAGIWLFFPILMVVLYATQRKYLIN